MHYAPFHEKIGNNLREGKKTANKKTFRTSPLSSDPQTKGTNDEKI